MFKRAKGAYTSLYLQPKKIQLLYFISFVNEFQIKGTHLL